MSDGLEQRKNELFATITLLAGVKTDLAQAQADGRNPLPLIERQAQLEADKERLSHEVNAEYMYRNLLAFMNRVDAYDTARKEEAAAFLGLLQGVQATQGQFQERIEALEVLNHERAKTDIDKIERLQRIEDALVQIGHEVLVDEIGRRDRLENVAFLALLKQKYPDLAAQARKVAEEADHG